MILDDFFENISLQFNMQLPFVVYRKPNETTVKSLLQKDSELYITNDFTESGFVFSPFNTEEKSVLIPTENSIVIELVGEHFENVNMQKSTIVEALETNTNARRLQHINIVEKAIQTIHSENLKKVVLSRCETLPHLDNNPLTIFKRLLHTYASAFVYCWYHPKIGLWLGATPETLLKIEGNRFETMSLAGTQEYKDSLDVEWQTKEKEEQEIVTDSVLESLQHFSTTIQVSDTETIKAGNLLHLKTKISGILNPVQQNLQKVLRSLHPTPAICGFPKEEAKHFILGNEAYNREFYTGFLGELNITQTQSRNKNRRNVENNAYASIKTVTNLFVNLRCMQLKDNEAFIYVGGGITKDSIAEKEWEETQKKTQTMKSVL